MAATKRAMLQPTADGQRRGRRSKTRRTPTRAPRRWPGASVAPLRRASPTPQGHRPSRRRPAGACGCADVPGSEAAAPFPTPLLKKRPVLHYGLRFTSAIRPVGRLVMTSEAIAKCRVLVVDDDRGFRHAIGTLL